MNIRPIALFAAALLAAFPAFAEDKVFAPTDLAGLKEMNGREVTVEGTVAAQAENKAATVRYLNFSKNYRESLALVFFAGKSADDFSKEKLGAFVGKKVRVTGAVGMYHDAPQIRIDKLDQIKVQP